MRRDRVSRISSWRKSFHGRRLLTYYGYYAEAGRSLMQEHFMVPRTMRKYWGDESGALSGPLCIVSRWLQYKICRCPSYGRNKKQRLNKLLREI